MRSKVKGGRLLIQPNDMPDLNDELDDGYTTDKQHSIGREAY